MNSGEMRAILADLPDDAEILVENEEPLRYYEVYLRWKLEPVLDHGWAILFDTGQCWNEEFDLDARIDAKIGHPG